MQAVVMAGGAGSRLRPLTIGRPKPMVPLVNKPVIGHIRDLLVGHQITDIVATVQYLADAVEDYLGDGSAHNCRIRYAHEDAPLGTAGGVRNAGALLDETFVVISGDALTDFDLAKALQFHRDKKAGVTLVLYRVPNPLEYGVVITAPDGRVQRFQEKPSWGEVISDTVNTGIYIIEPEVLEDIPAGRSFDFSKDLFPMLLMKGAPLFAVVLEGYWTDIGDLREYRRAAADLLRGEVRLPEPVGERIGANIFADGPLDVPPDAQLYGPIYFGPGTQLCEAAVIHGPTSIGANCTIDARAHLDRTILWDHVYVGEGAEVRGAVVQRGASVKRRAVLFEGTVVGDDSVVGEDAVLHPDVLIWPNKEVEAGATLKRSVIWGSKGRRSHFGRYGITGLVNVDLTPEYAARIGAAFASNLPLGSRVVINRDGHRSPRMIKRALISGIPSAGVNAWDTQSVPMPVARYFTRITDATGGMHVRISPFDRRVVDVRFFGDDGLDLAKDRERKIEQTIAREDFRRVFLDDVGTIAYATGVVERYATGYLDALDVDVIRARRPRLVIDYANASTSQVVPYLVGRLGCEVIALNANLDENRLAISRTQLDDELRQMGQIAKAVDADLAARFDVGGELLFVVDDAGQIAAPDRFAAAMAELEWQAHPGATIAVPADAPGLFEILADRHGGVVRRTRVDLAELMRAAADDGVRLAADTEGHLIFPELHPAADGLFALAKLLEGLARSETTLSAVLDGIPAWTSMRRTVPCPWEHKGLVMRRLNEQYRAAADAPADGVRVNVGADWVLVYPDPDEPRFHVLGDASSFEQAQTLADRYARIVETLIG